MNSYRNLLLLSMILLATAVILGAFGAHSLKKIIDAEALVTFETGVRYQFYLGLTLLGLSAVGPSLPFSLKWSTRLMFWGIMLFSGSIYLLAIQKPAGLEIGKIIGPITPIGGSLIIAGFVVLIVKLIQHRNN